MNKILEEDLKEIAYSDLINWNKFKNKKILITGATGLIGSLIVKSFIQRNEEFNNNINMILIVRDQEKAKEVFRNNQNIFYIEKNIEEYKNINNLNIDYIIHGASPTKSKMFVNNPVETIDTAILGTKKILEQAKNSKIKSMVYLSSMEMYGTMNSKNVTENDLGYINPLNIRSSYSEGKRICELYCSSYWHEYNIPVKIARIAQTFGAGISKDENRVYKVFVDSILNKEDIILKSSGTTAINFSYTTDTIIGILKILLDGNNGEAYNIVSNNPNMTILDSAKWLADTYAKGIVDVKIDIPKENMGFAPDNNMILNNEKLKSIGWNCKYDLKNGYDRLIRYLKEENKND